MNVLSKNEYASILAVGMPYCSLDERRARARGRFEYEIRNQFVQNKRATLNLRYLDDVTVAKALPFISFLCKKKNLTCTLYQTKPSKTLEKFAMWYCNLTVDQHQIVSFTSHNFVVK